MLISCLPKETGQEGISVKAVAYYVLARTAEIAKIFAHKASLQIKRGLIFLVHYLPKNGRNYFRRAESLSEKN